MEILEQFDFDKRPSRSRYADVIKALVEDGVHAVKITRGEKEFPAEVSIETVQGGISTQVREAGRTAVTRKLGDDVLVVGLEDSRAKRPRKTTNGRKKDLVPA